MSTETDLLPLPEPHWIGMDTCDAPGPRHYTADQMHAYARANVAHATAAKDADIEALRTEVGETKEVAVRAMRQRDAQYNRAERLAEALRAEIPVLRRIAGFGNMSDEMTEEVADRLESALNLATQENDDA